MAICESLWEIVILYLLCENFTMVQNCTSTPWKNQLTFERERIIEIWYIDINACIYF